MYVPALFVRRGYEKKQKDRFRYLIIGNRFKGFYYAKIQLFLSFQYFTA